MLSFGFLAAAFAAQPVLDTPTGEAVGVEPLALNFESAEATETLSHDQHDWLKPKRSRLAPNPRGSVDFTAYTLEWGEAQFGLTRMSVGLLPRTQLGTNIPMDILGVKNGQVKVNVLRAGPLDLAVEGSHYRLTQDSFMASYTGIGGTASVILAPWVSIHTGGTWHRASLQGVPDLTTLSPLLVGTPAEGFEDVAMNLASDYAEDIGVTAETVRLHVATDFRLNRRDSIVLQGNAYVSSRVQTEIPDLEIPPILGFDEVLANEGWIPLATSYTASIAWQINWKAAQLRLGVGTSTIPGAWLLQSTELSWRFGGKTRRAEKRQRKTWRKNWRDVEVASAG